MAFDRFRRRELDVQLKVGELLFRADHALSGFGPSFIDHPAGSPVEVCQALKSLPVPINTVASGAGIGPTPRA
jgi:hypothetical protein